MVEMDIPSIMEAMQASGKELAKNAIHAIVALDHAETPEESTEQMGNICQMLMILSCRVMFTEAENLQTFMMELQGLFSVFSQPELTGEI